MEANENTLDCWEIVHIPEKPPICPELQPTVDVLASPIDAKHANTIVRKLNHVAPLEGLRHVKRIKKTSLDGGKSELFVILCIASGNDGESNHIPEFVRGLMNTYQYVNMLLQQKKNGRNNASCGQLPSILPLCELLRCQFNIDGITGFSEKDSLSVLNFMKCVVHMAKCGTSFVNAAVIVDPSSGEIIASSCDEVLCRGTLIYGSSKESCGMKDHDTAIEGNADEIEKDLISNGANQSYKGVSCLHPWGWLEQRLLSSLDYLHPLRHAAIVAIEKSAARDKHLFPMNIRDAETVQEDYQLATPSGSPSKRQKVRNDERLDCDKNGSKYDPTIPYLCTGYDIYFVWEPCAMCSMAIMHQRIRRVFYAFPNPNDGALGSVHRLQGERSLNHHYAVFRIMVPEDVLN